MSTYTGKQEEITQLAEIAEASVKNGTAELLSPVKELELIYGEGQQVLVQVYKDNEACLLQKKSDGSREKIIVNSDKNNLGFVGSISRRYAGLIVKGIVFPYQNEKENSFSVPFPNPSELVAA